MGVWPKATTAQAGQLKLGHKLAQGVGHQGHHSQGAQEGHELAQEGMLAELAIASKDRSIRVSSIGRRP